MRIKSSSFGISNINYYCAFLIFVISTYILFSVGGGPITNDELKYLKVSMFDNAEPRLLNRYAHIYIQKIAFWISGDVIAGFQLMWALLISATATSIYWSIQVLTKWKHPFLGFLGVFVFLSQPLIFRFVGVTYVDFTVMATISISLAIYLNQTQKEDVSGLSAILIGVLFFVAVKSKEPGVVSILFLIGLLTQFYQNKNWLIVLKYWFLGAFSSFLLLVIADAYFLGDLLFSVRTNNVGALVDFNTGNRIRINANWFSIITTSALLVPFVFYLASIFSSNNDEKFQIKIVYLIPIAFIFFLTMAMLFGRVRAIPRYIIPIIPLFCIFSVVYLENIGAFKKSVFRFSSLFKWVSSLSIFISICIVFIVIKDHTSGVIFNGWTPKLLLYDIFYPLIVMSLLGAMIFFGKYSLFRIRVAILSLALAVSPMLLILPNNLLYSSKVFEERSEPIEIFINQIEVGENTRFLLTPSAGFTKQGVFVGALLPLYFKLPFECVHVQSKYPIICKQPGDQLYSEPLNSNWKEDIKVDYIIASISDLDNWKIEDEFSIKPFSIIRKGNYALLCFREECSKP